MEEDSETEKGTRAVFGYRARFQYMSDLHLEKRSAPVLTAAHARAPFLLLAGDIGDPAQPAYVEFLRTASALFDAVFVVAGNHESHGRGLAEAEAACVAAADAAAANVFFLSRHRPVPEPVPGVRVLGCTLWSRVPPEAAEVVLSCSGDCRRISGFGVGAWNAEHAADVAWLRERLTEAAADGARCLVVTHHPPLMEGTSAPRHEECTGRMRMLRHAFGTDLRPMLRAFAAEAPVWVHGHTHHSHVFLDGAVSIAANQRGYEGEEGEELFRLDVEPLEMF